MSSSIKMEVELVINVCFGGFGLSDRAEAMLADRKSFAINREPESDRYLMIDGTWSRPSMVVERNDPELIAVVREMGTAANGECAKLKIVCITAAVDIESHDGFEEASVSRSW